MRALFDAVSGPANPTARQTVYSWSHICSGEQRLLQVTVAFRRVVDANTVTGVTYGGVPLSFIAAVNNGTAVRVECWGLLNPPSGSNTVQVTTTDVGGNGGVVALCKALSYKSVEPTSGWRNVNTATAGGVVTTAAVVVTSEPDDLVVDAGGGSAGAQSFDADVSQTQRYEEAFAPVAGLGINGGGSEENGAASVSMDWSTTGAGFTWALIGMSLMPFLPPASWWMTRPLWVPQPKVNY